VKQGDPECGLGVKSPGFSAGQVGVAMHGPNHSLGNLLVGLEPVEISYLWVRRDRAIALSGARRERMIREHQWSRNQLKARTEGRVRVFLSDGTFHATFWRRLRDLMHDTSSRVRERGARRVVGQQDPRKADGRTVVFLSDGTFHATFWRRLRDLMHDTSSRVRERGARCSSLRRGFPCTAQPRPV